MLAIAGMQAASERCSIADMLQHPFITRRRGVTAKISSQGSSDRFFKASELLNSPRSPAGVSLKASRPVEAPATPNLSQPPARSVAVATLRQASAVVAQQKSQAHKLPPVAKNDDPTTQQVTRQQPPATRLLSKKKILSPFLMAPLPGVRHAKGPSIPKMPNPTRPAASPKPSTLLVEADINSQAPRCTVTPPRRAFSSALHRLDMYKRSAGRLLAVQPRPANALSSAGIRRGGATPASSQASREPQAAVACQLPPMKHRGATASRSPAVAPFTADAAVGGGKLRTIATAPTR